MYNSYFPVDEEDYVSPRSHDNFNYYPVKEVTRSFNGDIEYIDEIIDEDVPVDGIEKGRMGSLLINGNDKRPKCQPVGAQIDCR